MLRHRLQLFSSLLFAPVLTAQLSFDLLLIEELPATTSRIVAGRFSGKVLPDLATMSGDGQVQAVFQPRTWKLPYDLRVVGATDMACVQRAASEEDRLLIVGGGLPRLSKFVPGVGYELVNLEGTGWNQVERIAVGRGAAGYRVAGYKSNSGQLRFGELDPTELDESLLTVGVQTLAHPLLDMSFADWDANGSAPELIVLTTNGISVYDWNGGAPRADGPAPFTVTEGHVARVTVGSRRVVWVHRAGAAQAWQCQAGSTSGVVSVALPSEIGSKPIGALAAASTTARNEMLVMLDNAPPAIPEALVVRIDAAGVATVDWVSPEAPAHGVSCSEFVDLDGDLEADGIWPIVGVEALKVKRPKGTIGGDEQRVLYLADFEEKESMPGSVNLTFSSEVTGDVTVRTFRQDNVNAPLNSVGALSTASLSGGGEMTVALVGERDSQAIFYLEIEILLASGEIAVLLCPYLHDTWFAVAPDEPDPRMVYVESRIAQEGVRPQIIRDVARRISVIKTPLDYEIGLPPLSPPTAD